jgi:hypothetical protein
MAVVSDKQFFILLALGLAVAVAAAFAGRVAAKDAEKALSDVKAQGQKLPHQIIGLTRDVKEDSSTFLSRGWFSKQMDSLFGGDYEPMTDSPYGSNKPPSDMDLPVFESGVIVPYNPVY